MRRLDDLFDRLARRGRHDDVDDVLDRLERRLAGEPEAVVLRGRGNIQGARRSGRRRVLVAASAAIVVILAIGVPLLLLFGGDGPEAADPTPITSPAPSAPTTTASEAEPTTTTAVATTGPESMESRLQSEARTAAMNLDAASDELEAAWVSLRTGLTALEEGDLADPDWLESCCTWEPATIAALLAEIDQLFSVCDSNPSTPCPDRLVWQSLRASPSPTDALAAANSQADVNAAVADLGTLVVDVIGEARYISETFCVNWGCSGEPPARPYPAGAALEDVAAMYAAWNRGDVDGVIERSGRVSNRNTVLIAILGGGARIVADCAVTGIGPSAHGGRGVVVSIACAELITDNFYTPAGIIHENTVTWEVNADGMRTWTGANMDVTLVRGDAWAFLLDFDEWLYHQESLDVNGWIWSHPEYGLPNNIGAPCCPYSTETWSSVRQAVALVPEFLAIPDDEWELIERPGTETCGARWEYLTTTIANQLPEPAGEIHRLLTDISHQVTRPDPVSTQILGETAALLDQVIGEALADSDSHPVELIEILQGIEGTGAALIDQVIPGARPTGQTICEWLEDMDAVRALLAAGD